MSAEAIAQLVFVAAEEAKVLGVYSTREKAQAACNEWSKGAVDWGNWCRFDGAWQREVLYVKGENWLLQRVTEDTIDE